MDNSLNNLELAYQKLAVLEKALILAVDPSVKFKTEHEILELKQQIANLTGFENLSGLEVSETNFPSFATRGKWLTVTNKFLLSVLVQ